MLPSSLHILLCWGLSLLCLPTESCALCFSSCSLISCLVRRKYLHKEMLNQRYVWTEVIRTVNSPVSSYRRQRMNVEQLKPLQSMEVQFCKMQKDCKVHFTSSRHEHLIQWETFFIITLYVETNVRHLISRHACILRWANIKYNWCNVLKAHSTA